MAGYIFGDRQGLAVFSGHVYAAWSGDQSGGVNEARTRLNILIAPMRIAAGPRVVSSTMGVATPLTVPVPPPGGPIHDQHPRSGHRDSPVRRVLGPVRPRCRSEHVHGGEIERCPGPVPRSCTWPRGVVGGRPSPLTNVSIISQDMQPSQLGVMSFLVTFSPLEGVGTYSYAIGPGVSDRIRTASVAGAADLHGQQDGSERRRPAGTAHARPVCDAHARSTARRSSRLMTRPRCRSSSPARASSHRGPGRQRQPDRGADRQREPRAEH